MCGWQFTWVIVWLWSWLHTRMTTKHFGNCRITFLQAKNLFHYILNEDIWFNLHFILRWNGLKSNKSIIIIYIQIVNLNVWFCSTRKGCLLLWERMLSDFYWISFWVKPLLDICLRWWEPFLTRKTFSQELVIFNWWPTTMDAHKGRGTLKDVV